MKKLLKYGMPILIGIAVSVGVMLADWNRVSSLDIEYNQKVLMCLCDGTFVTAILYVGFGLLIYAASEGSFDMLSYGFKSLLYLFTPIKKDPDEGGYYEYKMRKKEKRKAVPYHVLIIGAGFFVISIGLYIAQALV